MTGVQTCALPISLAEQLDGDDKNKMIEIAEAWLKLADEAAKTALKIDNELPRK